MVAQLQAVNGVQAIIGYNFVNANTLWLALQAAGSGVGGKDGNKVQAMLGDAVLKLVLIDNLSEAGHTRGTYHLHPYIHQHITHSGLGSIDQAVQSIVSNNNLAERCTATGITQFINVNPSQGNEKAPKTRSATVEAVLAAVYTDSGRNIVKVQEVMHALGLDAPNAPIAPIVPN